MKIRLLTVAVFLSNTLVIAPLVAQMSPLDNQQNITAAGAGYSPSNNMMRTFDNRFKGVEGSPYLLNSWKQGQIISTEGSVFNDVMIRYNIETDDLSIASNEGGTITIPREDITEFTLTDRYESYRFQSIEDPSNPTGRKIFCEVIEEGPVQVLIQHRKYFVPGSATLAFGNQASSEYKYHQDRYYLRKRTSGKTLKVGRLNGKAFRFLANYEQEMKEIARDREWFVTNPEQLVMLIQYYNMMARANQ